MRLVHAHEKAMTIPELELIAQLKYERNAVILAHTYQPGEVQDAADFVGDSYGLSVEASRVDAQVIIFCGVRFMAETAAILNPGKTVILAEPTAGCPMAEMITAEELARFKERYPESVVICYVNSTADVKALSDICCTSSNAVTIVRRIPPERGIIFVPDKHLGSYVQEQTGRNMELWNGFCPTHQRITPAMVAKARAAYPGACMMMHPEAPPESRRLADQILSTGQMCSFAAKDQAREYIVATEIGVIHTLQKRNPAKRFYPLSGEITCPNMRKGSLSSIINALQGTGGERIIVAPKIAAAAQRALRRMLLEDGGRTP